MLVPCPCCRSFAKSCPTLVIPWTAARQDSLSFTISQSLLKIMSIELVRPSNHLILCHPLLFSSPHSFAASESFPVSWLLWSGGQSIGASASASVLPMNIQDWLVWSPCSPGDCQQSSPTPQFKSINSSPLSFLHSPTLTSMTTGKTIALTRRTFVGKVI